MLSNEKSPQVPSESLQSKSSCKNFIASDERSSDDSNKVDLFQSGLGEINQANPKFSIRNYVISKRAKDIETHWPFSSKYLQLCLKHSVEDVLPPFETLESMKSPSRAIKFTDKNTSNPSENSRQKLASGANWAIDSKPPENDTTDVSCSDVNSYPLQPKIPFLEPKFLDLLVLKKPETAVRAAEARSSHIARKPVKKCSSIVESRTNNVAEQNLNKDSLETTMGSKVCPVCKTFTSPSNTTLNAHIDQCLSRESSVQWMAKPRVAKHRVKPRKTRLMVDIYQTALPCTLEDLDRRNGTNWASNLDFPAQYSGNSVYSDIRNDINGGNNKEQGDVYFDSSGTKLRILSKFSDVKSNYSNEADDYRTKRLLERNKASKIVPKKKKLLLQRHKFLKCPLLGQRRSSPRFELRPEVLTMKSQDSRIIRHWTSSIRTGLENDKIHHLNKITKKSKMSNRHLPSQADKLMKSTDDLNFSISSDDDSVSDTDSSRKRKGSTPLELVDEYMPCQINRAGFFSFSPREFPSDGDYEHNYMVMHTKSNSKRLEESGPSPFSGVKKDLASFRRNKKTRILERQKLSPLNKNQSFINQIRIPESQRILRKEKIVFDKPRHEETLGPSKILMPQLERDARNLSINQSRDLNIHKEKWGFLNPSKENSMLSDHFDEYAEPNCGVVEQDINSSVTDTIEVVEIQDEFVRESTIEIPQITIAFPKSLEHEECEQEMSYLEKVNREPVDIIDVNEGQGNYSFGVDPIPIPGPPDSFLPSPARMHSPKHDGPRSDSQSSYKSFVYNSIPVVERPGLFERDQAVDQPNINWARANLLIPEVKFPSPSPTNPVLRLMGKNLMVGTRDENAPPLTGSRPSCVMNNFGNLQLTSDIQNVCQPFNRNLYVGPPFLDSLHSHPSFTTDLSPNASWAMSPSSNANEGSRSSSELLDRPVSMVGLDHLLVRPGFEKDPIFFPRSTRAPSSCGMNVLHEQEPGSTFETKYRERKEFGALGFESGHPNSVFSCQTRCYPSKSWLMVESANITQNNGNSDNLNLRMPGIASALMNRDLLTESTGHYRASSMNLSHGFSSPANFA